MSSSSSSPISFSILLLRASIALLFCALTLPICRTLASTHKFDLDTQLPSFEHLQASSLPLTTDSHDKWRADWRYIDHEQLTWALQAMADRYPNLTRLYSIGMSIQGRDLWVLQMHDKSGRTNDKHLEVIPKVKLVGNIHGNEPIGGQLLLYLAHYLLTGHDKSAEIGRLLQTTELHLLFSMNPDGVLVANEGDCYGNSHRSNGFSGRTNADGIDLEIAFPSRSQNLTHPLDRMMRDPRLSGNKPSSMNLRLKVATAPNGKQYLDYPRPPEVEAVISWSLHNQFALSVVLHSGELVITYPWTSMKSHARSDMLKVNPTDQDAMFHFLASELSTAHALMANSSSCHDQPFTTSVANGAAWMPLIGFMGDFNYEFADTFELTASIDCCKFPVANQLPAVWIANRAFLLRPLQLSHFAVKGVCRDDLSSLPVSGVRLHVTGESKPTISGASGEFVRLLLNGTYSLTFEADGYARLTVENVAIVNDPLSDGKWIDCRLHRQTRSVKKPEAPNESPVTSSNVNGDLKENGGDRRGDVEHYEFTYHQHDQLTKQLHLLQKAYSDLARVYSIGKSVDNRDLWVIEISTNPGQHVLLQPEVKLIANIHGNEPVGRELLLILAQHLLEKFGVDPEITRLVNSTRIHLLPSLNPDGFARSRVGKSLSRTEYAFLLLLHCDR
jgi:carboxypeptidase D